MTNVAECLDGKVLVNDKMVVSKLNLADASLNLVVDILLGLAMQEEIGNASTRDCGQAA